MAKKRTKRSVARMPVGAPPGHDPAELEGSSQRPERVDPLRSLPFGLTAPIYVMAPMVKQCDRPFRDLCRAHGCSVCYTEMFMADQFSKDAQYRARALGTGVAPGDHPLVVQFASNNPATMLEAALQAQAMGRWT